MLSQTVDDELVVDDLVAHIDWRAMLLERQNDDLDRAVNTGAKAARFAQADGQRLQIVSGHESQRSFPADLQVTAQRGAVKTKPARFSAAFGSATPRHPRHLPGPGPDHTR